MRLVRMLFAGVVAPIAPLIVIALITGKGFIEPLAVYFGYFTMLFFGLPILCVCMNEHWTQWWQLTLAGAFAGALMPIGFIFLDAVIGSTADPVSLALGWLPLSALVAMLGTGSGFVFWFVGLYSPLKK